MDYQLTHAGIRLYTDLDAALLHLPFVSFTDGSWCNLADNDVDVRSDHPIELRRYDDAGEPTWLARYVKLNGKRLLLRNLRAHIGVKAEERTDIQLGTIGSPDAVNAVRVDSGTTALALSNPPDATPPQLVLLVPIGCEVNLLNVSGTVDIDSRDGMLSANLVDGCTVRAASLCNAFLEVNGSSRIDIATVTGSVSIDAHDGAEIDINAGQLHTLMVKATGESHVGYGGSTVTASLVAYGSRVTVQHVKQAPTQKQDDTGLVRVRNTG